MHLEPQPDDEARAQMAANLPGEYVETFFNLYRDGALDESPILPTVEHILGRKPRAFTEWATSHADAFPLESIET